MKKRTAFIGAILSLMPIGHPFFVQTGVLVSSAGLMFTASKNAYAAI